MKKLISLLVLLPLLLGALSGCQEIISGLPLSEDNLLSVCGSFAVPGLYCSDLKGGTYTVNILERDEQGRILYEYTAKSLITGKQETALVICQQLENSAVWFFEDECYLLGESTEQSIARLKERNQWGKELSLAYASKREINITSDLFLTMDAPFEHSKLKEECCKKWGLSQSQIKELAILDTAAGSGLYWLVYENGGKTVSGYFLATSQGYAFLEATSHASPETLAAFKAENGW